MSTKNPILTQIVLGLFMLCSQADAQELQAYHFDQPAMGTKLNIILYAENQLIANKGAKAAFDKVNDLNAIFSDYMEHSEVNCLYKEGNLGRWINISKALFDLLSVSKKISKDTHGAFDITVGAYTQLWRKSKKMGKLPSQKQLAEAKKSIGFKAIRLNHKRMAVKIKKEKLRIDFGAIAKGYAAQQILKLLGNYGIDRALVDFGGDITVSDPPPNKKGWSIEVNDHSGARTYPDLFLLDNGSVATSGDLYQNISVNNKTYSHIINPSTGLGITESIQVTVISRSGTLADAFATAFSVMDKEDIKKFLKKKRNKDMHVLISYVQNGSVKVWASEHLHTFKSRP